jgi:nucleotide-binding universal stress UspA family protein
MEQTGRPVFRRIVVGVDGSPSSVEALAWAIAVARSGGGEVVPVQAWLPDHGPDDKERSTARHKGAFLRLVEGVNTSHVDVRPQFVVGERVDAITRAAEDADLVVLGTPHRHGIPRLVLGSFAGELTGRLEVPVVSMPAPLAAAAVSEHTS